MRALIVATAFGIALAGVVILLVAATGALYGRPRGVPWVCDDTRYVATVPVGRVVVGSSVSAPPGCGA